MSRRPPALLLIAGCLLVAGCGSSHSTTGARHPSTTPAGTTPGSPASKLLSFEGVPLELGRVLAPAGTTGTAPVDGITCTPGEQVAYHIHAYLLVYDNGQPVSLPGGIGIPGSQVTETQYGPVAVGSRCIYWLHTHAPDGVIHIESPTRRQYTLGQFFDEWHQPLAGDRIGALRGTMAVAVDGRPWRGAVRSIPLLPHEDIQISVGRPVGPFQALDWSHTHL